jgi:uncharacterized protein YdeI (BOF family)
MSIFLHPCRVLPVLVIGVLCRAAAQDTYTEANFPTPLVLKPGLTQITGGITAADQQDRFYFRHTVGGNVTVRLRYTHRTGNILSGITELPHLSGSLLEGSYSNGAIIVPSGAPVALSSPFYIQNAQNTISAARSAGDFTSFDGFELTISAPAGKTNPDYTIELEYQPTADAWEGASGNNSLANAAVLDPNIFGDITGNLHGATDSDWFRFDVPAGRMLRVNISDRGFAGAALTPQFAILNAQGVPLQTANQSIFAGFMETAGAGGETFYIRINPQDAYAEAWRLLWLLEDDLDPNETLAQARHLGTLASGGRIDHRNLSTASFAADYYTFDTNLPAGTRILIAALPDPQTAQTGGPSLQMVQSGNYSIESYSNYLELYDNGSGPVSFVINSSTPQRYRLLIKPFTDYDVWQRNVSAFEFGHFLHYLPAESDFDRDGLPAGLEWALRSSPFKAAPGAISAPYFDGSVWKVNVAMPQGGSAAPIVVRESTDLSAWTAPPAGRTNFGGGTIPSGRTSGAVITLSRPGEPRNFLRFGVDD